jgi:hypothetical protein
MVSAFGLMLLALTPSLNECVVNTQTNQTEPSTTTRHCRDLVQLPVAV